MKNKSRWTIIGLYILALISSGLSFGKDNSMPTEFNILKAYTLSNGTSLKIPYGVALDESRGFIYIADTGNDCIRKLNIYGDYLSTIGTYGSGDGQFAQPQGVCVVKSTGEIYVIDTGNNRIQKFDQNGNHLLTFGGVYGSELNQFKTPRDAAIDGNGNIYICDAGNGRIMKYSSTGTALKVIGIDSGLLIPIGVDVDASGNIFVADSEHNRIVKFDSAGVYLSEFGTEGFKPGEFLKPSDVAINNKGDIFIADTGNNRIQKFNSQGVFVKSYENELSLVSIQKLAVDSKDRLYIVDSDDNRFLIYNAGTYITNVSVAPLYSSPDGDGYQDSTFIYYTIPEPAKMTIKIYNETGTLIRTLLQNTARMTLDNKEEWDGKDNQGKAMDTGKYICRLDAVNAANYYAPQVSTTINIFLGHGEISGTVTNGLYPVYNATVTDGYRTVKTDLNGYYKIRNIISGTMLTVSVTKDGYAPAENIAVLSNNEDIISDFNFVIGSDEPLLGTISGTIKDINNNPLKDVKVTKGGLSTLTDQNGLYILDGISAGEHTLTASKYGYRVSSLSFALDAGEVLKDKDIIMDISQKPEMHVDPLSLDIHTQPYSPLAVFGNQPAPDTAGNSNIPLSANTETVSASSAKGEIIPDEYIIKFKQASGDSSRNQLLSQLNTRLLKKNRMQNTYLVKQHDISAIKDEYRRTKGAPDIEKKRQLLKALNNQRNLFDQMIKDLQKKMIN